MLLGLEGAYELPELGVCGVQLDINSLNEFLGGLIVLMAGAVSAHGQ